MSDINLQSISLQEASDDQRHEIAMWYCDVFNDPEIFGDSWTVESATQCVFSDAAKTRNRVFLAYRGDKLAGVAVVVISNRGEVISMRELPPEFRDARHLEAVKRQIQWFADVDEDIMVFREIGVRKEYRGDVELAMRMVSMATSWAVDDGATFGCFWTSKVSPVYRLLRAYDIRDLYNFGGARRLIMMGDDPRGALKRLRKSAIKHRRVLVERLLHQGVTE